MNTKKYISVKQFAGIVGVDVKLIRRYINDGTIKSARKKGGYKNSAWEIHKDKAQDELRDNLGPNSKKIISKIGRKKTFDKKTKKTTEEKIKALEGVTLVSFNDARELDMNYKAHIRKLSYEEKKGNLIERIDVEKSAFIAGKAIKDKLISIADRLAPIVANNDSIHECRQLIKDEINHILNDLSNVLNRLDIKKD